MIYSYTVVVGKGRFHQTLIEWSRLHYLGHCSSSHNRRNVKSAFIDILQYNVFVEYYTAFSTGNIFISFVFAPIEKLEV